MAITEATSSDTNIASQRAESAEEAPASVPAPKGAPKKGANEPPKDTTENAPDDSVETKDEGLGRSVGKLTSAVTSGAKKAWELAGEAQRKIAERGPGSAPKAPTPNAGARQTQDDTPATKPDVANAANAASEVAGKSAGWLDDAADSAAKGGAKSAGRGSAVTKWIGRGKGFVLGTLAHYYGDDPVAQTRTGHAVASGTKSALDVTAGAAMAGSPSVSPTAKGLGITGFVGSVVDGFVDVDNPAKIVTSTMKDANPGAVISGGHAGVVDGATVVGNVITGDKKAAYAGAERMQENAIKGDYSQAGSALTWGVAMAAGDHETVNKYTDTAAKSGDRGFWLAFGNFIADGGDPHADRGTKFSKYDGKDRQISSSYMTDRAGELANAGDPNEGEPVSGGDRGKARTVVREAAERRLFGLDGVDRRRLLGYLPTVSPNARRAFLAGEGRDDPELREHYRVYDGINNAYRITQDQAVSADSSPRVSRVQSAARETPRLDK